MLSAMAGVAAQLQQPALWPSWVYASIALGALAALIVRIRWGNRPSMIGVSVALAVAGFAGTGWRAQQAEPMPAALEGRDLVLVGVIDQMPQVTPDGFRFVFEAQSGRLDGLPVAVPGRVSLVWFRGWHEDALLAGPQVDLRAGQRWALPVRLRQPHGPMNPHGFDTELWMYERGLRASGYVRITPGGLQPSLLVEEGWRPIERLRQSIRDAVILRVADARIGGVLAALAVGDQAAIERSDWDLFRNTGVSHLMSISGLHVTMFAWLAGGLLAWVWRSSGRLSLMLPSPLAGRWGGLGAAAAYALVAGWGVPAQRTLLMLATAVALQGAGLSWPWPLVLLLAASVVTLLDPWAMLQAGFWLSFAAVGLLLASEPVRRSGDRDMSWVARAKSVLRSQAIATLGLAPLSMVFFQQVSIAGFAANLVAIPWVTLVVTPLALLGALVPALWSLAAAAVALLVAALQWLASGPWTVWTAPAAPARAVSAGLLAGAVGLLPLPWRLRLLALPLALPLIWPVAARPAMGRFELVAVDIGQGTAVLIRTRAHLLVYDTGPAYARDGDAGQRILVPLLRAGGDSRIDLLVLSHRDNDHVGGANSVGAAVPVLAWSSSLDETHPLRRPAQPHARCDAGQQWEWDGVRFEMLHPVAADHERERKPNALSCVLRVQDASGRSALLTGDIEAAQKAALVARLGDRLRSTMLLVPHHGSRTLSSEAFVDAVSPQVAVVQAGYRSRFGHPAADVVARYQSRGIMLVRSDRCGAWTWHDGASECARDARRRYWHWRIDAPGAEVATPIDAGDRRRWPRDSTK